MLDLHEQSRELGLSQVGLEEPGQVPSRLFLRPGQVPWRSPSGGHDEEAARVRVGQQVRFTLDAAPDKVFLGEITELASVIHTRSINQPDKVFDATVRLLNPDTELMRPGMNINAEVLLDRGQEVAGL